MASKVNWREKLTFLTPTYTVSEVAGHEVNFYPLSPGMLFKLRSIARPLSQAISVLFSDKSNDQARTQKDTVSAAATYTDEDGNVVDDPGGRISTTTIEAVSTDMLIARSNMRERAIDSLLDAFMKPESMRVIAGIIWDSCREAFGRDWTDEDLDDFLASDQVNAAYLSQFLLGVAKANLEVFGPTGGKVFAAFSKKLDDTLENNLVDESAASEESDPSTAPESMSSPTEQKSPQPQPTAVRPPTVPPQPMPSGLQPPRPQATRSPEMTPPPGS